MTYVLDASAAMPWVLSRPTSAKAHSLREEFRRGIHLLIAPSVFPAEVASGLTKAERQRVVPIGEAARLLVDVLSTKPVLYDYETLLDRAVDISSKTRSGFYDCLYVALAEREACELVTDDQRLIANLSPHFSFIVPLASLP